MSSLAGSLIRQLASFVTSWITSTSTDDSNWIMVQNTDAMLKEFNTLVDRGMPAKQALALVRANANIQQRLSNKED
jgi:hypothetical protein